MVPSRYRRPWSAIVGAMLAAALSACGGGEAPTQPAQTTPGIRAVAGGGVSDTAFSASLATLVVEVRGAGGALVKGATVRFSIRAAPDTTRQDGVPLYLCPLAAAKCGPFGFSYPPWQYLPAGGNGVVDSTDASGRARAQVRLGTIAGPAYVVVTAPDLGLADSVLFTVQPGALAGVVLAKHDVPLGVGASATLTASATDQYGNARAGAVAYTLGAAGGVATLSGATVTAVDFGSVYAYARAAAAVDSALVRVLPSGRLVLWDPANAAVRMMSTDGSAPRTLATDVGGAAYGALPRFSPDGRVVAFVKPGTGALVVLDSLGGSRRDVNLAAAGIGILGSAQPLADGTVSFVGYATSTTDVASTCWVFSLLPNGQIVKVAALPRFVSGSGVEFAGGYAPAAVSRDGARVAYEAVALGRAGGGAPVPIGLRVFTVATGQDVLVDTAGYSPAWSPSGNQVAYLLPDPSSLGGDGTLTVANAEGTGRRGVPSRRDYSPGIGWSPDGAYLVARSGTLRVIRVRDGVDVALTLPAQGGTNPSGVGDYYQADWR